MSRLKVVLRGAQISDLALNTEKEYIGGRKENCDIRLQAEKGISREHFKLKYEEGRWVVTSLSRFGEIYSLGQRVESIPLEHGQMFQVPPYEFEISDVPDAVVNVPQTDGAVDISENERTVIGVAQQVPHIKMMSASGTVREMLRLEVGDLWVAGRDASCQIIIPDQRVSRRQFELRKINGIYTIIDLSSVNGTFLNGSPISSTDPQPLKSGDAISVLDNTMYFELHDPNFQYRVERIEVPPIPLEQVRPDVDQLSLDDVAADDNENFENEEYLEDQYVEGDVQGQYPQEVDPAFYQNEQINPDGSVFTGMPNEQMRGDFYTFQKNEEKPPQSKIVEQWNKLKNNRPLLATVVILILALSYFVSESLNEPVVNKQQTVVNSNDPFERLTPEEKDNIVLWYGNAEKSLRQQSFSIAKENLDKIHKLLPGGYKDSKVYEIEALNGEQTIITQQENERREKVQAEEMATFKETIEKCEKSITPETTVAEIEECLQPATLIDPEHPDRVNMIARVQKLFDERRNKEESAKVLLAQNDELRALFAKAEEVNASGYPKKTIKAYQAVIDSSLPDVDNLKNTAKKRIKLIQGKIDNRNLNNISNAEVYLKEGKLKQGLISLREALAYDPENEIIKDKLERYSNELRNQVKAMYQESIIDENFGNVDGEENRPGAKEKWKKILEMDLEDGDYYRKAYIKLRKYGVL
ncbi:MAG: FHA domain-containing protein [Pseudobdellovibrio sp.]